MRKRRRSRGYRNSQRKGFKINLAPVILILCLSVGCGYATAEYVVAPVVNYIPQLTAERESEATQKKETEKTEETQETKAVVEDDVKVENTGKISGYAVQFGCYSSKAAAEKAMSELDAADLQVLEQNGMYKILGKVFDTKEQAKEALESLTDADKAFVTTVYE